MKENQKIIVVVSLLTAVGLLLFLELQAKIVTAQGMVNLRATTWT